MDTLDIECRKCGTPLPTITAVSAAHDTSLIDVVVTCEHCGLALNSFISLEEMSEIAAPAKETPDE